MARIGVVLSGCGVYDGTEIHEAVLTLLAIDEAGHEAICLAPRGPQMHVVDHATGHVTGDARDIFAESARIARGAPRALDGVTADDLDALVFPGGFGAAKNLCDFAVRGAEATARPDVAALVRAMHAAKKPLGFACIAPALAAVIFRDAGVRGVRLTIGDDIGTASDLDAMGAHHLACPVREVRVDADHRVVTTPAYMLAKRITEVRDSTQAMIRHVIELL